MLPSTLHGDNRYLWECRAPSLSKYSAAITSPYPESPEGLLPYRRCRPLQGLRCASLSKAEAPNHPSLFPLNGLEPHLTFNRHQPNNTTTTTGKSKDLASSLCSEAPSDFLPSSTSRSHQQLPRDGRFTFAPVVGDLLLLYDSRHDPTLTTTILLSHARHLPEEQTVCAWPHADWNCRT